MGFKEASEDGTTLPQSNFLSTTSPNTVGVRTPGGFIKATTS